MRNHLLAGVAALSVLAAGVANAADLPSRRGPVAAPAPVYTPPVFTWTGLYVGANAGYGFGKFTRDGRVFDDPDGFVGGGQIGYNWQYGQFVYGLETDLQYSDLKGAGKPGFLPADSSAKIEYFGTVRGRLGVAMDRWMPYVTGGFAYAEAKANIPFLGLSGSKTHYGYALGAGLEYAITNNLTLRGEYLFVSLEKERYFPSPATARVGTDFSVVRAAVNYKF